MNRLSYLIIISSIALTMWACDSLDSQPETLHTDVSLTGTQWEFVGFRVKGGFDTDLGPDRVTLSFSENDSLVRGTQRWEVDDDTAGNSYSGGFSVENSSLEISDLITTLVGGPAGSRYTEYYMALRNAISYDIQDNQLSVFNEDGEKVLLFKAVEVDK